MQNYKNIKVWQKAHELALSVYKTVESFPQYETFGLSSQMRRSAYSIPTNIAEGAGRKSNADFANFLHIALGSANEIDYQLLLAKDLGYLDEEKYQNFDKMINEIKAMLISFINVVKNNDLQQKKNNN